MPLAYRSVLFQRPHKDAPEMTSLPQSHTVDNTLKQLLSIPLTSDPKGKLDIRQGPKLVKIVDPQAFLMEDTRKGTFSHDP